MCSVIWDHDEKYTYEQTICNCWRKASILPLELQSILLLQQPDNNDSNKDSDRIVTTNYPDEYSDGIHDLVSLMNDVNLKVTENNVALDPVFNDSIFGSQVNENMSDIVSAMEL